MKKLILFLAFSMLFTSAVKSEELPEGFYEMEVVKNAIQEQTASLRKFTPEQLEVVYQASKILHDEYFGNFIDLRLPQGEYLIGDFIPAGTYRFTLGESDLATLWVENPKKIVHNYYSMNQSKNETEVILKLEEGWLFRVTYSSVYMTTMSGF